MDRRKFISQIAYASAMSTIPISLIAKSNEGAGSSLYINEDPEQYSNPERKIPKALKKGSKIAITAPASPTSPSEIYSTVKTLKSLGYEVEVGDTIKINTAQFRYFSDSEENRASEFMNFVVREDIDAIICGRGGYGVMRILEKLNFETIALNPKIIMGFSDITALLVAINKLSKLVCYHGPVASSSLSSFTLSNMNKILTEENKNQNIEFTYPNVIVVNEGISKGQLIGGNLRMIVSTLGTPYEIDTTNKILFLEEVSEHPYQFDRMLTQLLLARKLQNASAIVFGEVENLNQRRPFFPGTSFTIKEVIEQLTKNLNIPVTIGMPFGHVKEKLTLPLGIEAEINTKNKSLKLLENSVTF